MRWDDFEKKLLPAFGGLLRDPIGSTKYWETNRAGMRLQQTLWREPPEIGFRDLAGLSWT